MIPWSAVLAGLLLSTGGGADAGADGGLVLPAALAPWFDQKGPDGGLVIGPAQREYFSKLPDNTRQMMADAADGQILASAKHANVLLTLELSPQAMEIVLQDNCILCHTDPGLSVPSTRFSLDPRATGTPAHLNLKEFVSDVHFRRGLSCSGCHGGTPQDEYMTKAVGQRWPKKDQRHEDRTWIPGFCARCHADPDFMRNFNPGLPTDQLAKYEQSRHGELLLARTRLQGRAVRELPRRARHPRPEEPRARSSTPQTSPRPAAQCHADAEYMAGYKKADGRRRCPPTSSSSTRRACTARRCWSRDDLGAPACNDCHGNHAARLRRWLASPQVCRTCHVANGSSSTAASTRRRSRSTAGPSATSATASTRSPTRPTPWWGIRPERCAKTAMCGIRRMTRSAPQLRATSGRHSASWRRTRSP